MTIDPDMQEEEEGIELIEECCDRIIDVVSDYDESLLGLQAMAAAISSWIVAHADSKDAAMAAFFAVASSILSSVERADAEKLAPWCKPEGTRLQ